MLIVDIANEILMLDSVNPSATSLPAIAFFIRSSIGTVNNLLCEDFIINQNTLEITHCNGQNIGIDAAAVIKQIYKIYDAKLQMANTMNALANDSLLSVTDEFGGGTYTRVNKNEMAKVWASIMRQETERLDELVGLYKIRKSIPSAVFGDDTIPAHYGESLISLRNV